MKIKGRTTVRVDSQTFEDCARGYLNQLPNQKLNIDDGILIKEFNQNFTGNEIVGEVTDVEGDEFVFRKYAIVRGKAE